MDISKAFDIFAAERIYVNWKVARNWVFGFGMNIRAFLIKMIKNILDEYPLAYPFIKYISPPIKKS